MKALAQALDNLFLTISEKEKVPVVLDNWERIKESYKFIKRPDGKDRTIGKRLSSQDKQVLSVLIELIKKNKQIVDYKWLEEKLLKSQRTIKRILNNLGNCFDCKFYNSLEINNKRYFNKILITPTPQLQNILFESYGELAKTKYKKPYAKHFQNPYIIVDSDGQKCPEGSTKVSTPIYSNIRKQKNNITNTELDSTNARAREEFQQNNEIINQKTLVVAQLMKPPKVFCKEPSDTEPNSTAKIVKFMSQLHENPISNSTRSGSLQSEVANPQAFTTTNVITLLNTGDPSLTKIHLEICKSFGSLVGADLVKRIKFLILGEKKIGIKISNVEFSEEEKNQLRLCIKNVYGDDTKIVALGTNIKELDRDILSRTKEGGGEIVPSLPDKSAKDIISDKEPKLTLDIWELIRKKLIVQLHKGEFINTNWFSKLEASVDERLKKLTLKAPNSFIKDYIYENYLSYIEEIAAKNNFIVALVYYDGEIPFFSNPKKILKEIADYNN